MFSIVQKRRLFFTISSFVIAIGVLVMIFNTVATDAGAPFRLGIDFQGGSIYDISFADPTVTETEIRQIFASIGDEGVVVQRLQPLTVTGTDAARWSVRGAFLTDEETENLIAALEARSPIELNSTDQVSPTVGAEVARAALVAILLAAFVITGFIVFAFRQIPNAHRYGVSAIAAMVHDVFIMLGAVAIFGLLLGWEVDALFLTAVLTVVGYSVQDSIVLFDRIRENIPRYLGEPYETIANRSILETIHRSFATQLNAFFIMVALILFGGDTLRQFIAILFIGLVSGTYSSIFIAVPLLVAWEKGEIPFLKGSLQRSKEATV
jgi:preprotein translocase SecF subunit